MTPDLIDRRYLGAIALHNAVTGVRITAAMNVTADRIQLCRTRQGLLGIITARGLEAHTRSFQDAPTQPPIESRTYEISIRDPQRQYVPRRATIALPRDPDPAHSAAPNSLFSAIKVRMYPSAALAIASGWAAVRVTVCTAGANKTRLPHALVRVFRADNGNKIADALADERGEALVGVEGLPVTTFSASPGPVLSTALQTEFEVIFDPDVFEQLKRNGSYVVDPDDLERRRASLKHSRTGNIELRSGRVQSKVLEVSLV